MTLKTRDIVEIAVAVALAWVLSLFRVFRMPVGGSVSLEMVPLFYIALRRGGKTGMLAGATLGLLKLLVDPYIVHPVQVIMDYPLPFALVGLAGFVRSYPGLGVLIGAAARYLTHVVSGVIFFAEYAPEGTGVWTYSLTYNASYLVPETLVCLVVIILLWRQGVLKRNG